VIAAISAAMRWNWSGVGIVLELHLVDAIPHSAEWEEIR
jgi:hypothetical protein